MDLIYEFLSEEMVQALGWTVIHSLWQGVLAAGIFSLFMNLGRKRSATWRYRAGWIVLSSLFLSSVISFLCLYELPATTNGAEITRLIPIGEDAWAEAGIASDSTPVMDRYLPIVVAFWLTGAFVLMLRLLGGWAWLWRLRHHRTYATDSRWTILTENLASRLKIQKKVGLLESALISAPMALGHIKPLILFPIGALNQLSPQEVEAVLAHELSHIARHDFLLNLIQSMLEVLYYFHPAVWWMSARIRQERENCCDDMAVSLTGDSLTYAKALVNLEEFRKQTPALTLAFSGNKNHLMDRIKRILHQPRKSSTVMEKITVVCLLAAALTLLSFTKNPSPDLVETDSGNTIEVELDLVEEEFFPAADTIDPKVKRRVVVEEEGQVVELEMEDETVTGMSIDGEKVNPSDHAALVEEIKGDSDIQMALGSNNVFISPKGGKGDFVWTNANSEGGLVFEVRGDDGEPFVFHFDENEMNWFDENDNHVFFQDVDSDNFLFFFNDSIPEEELRELEREMENHQREMEEMHREMEIEFRRAAEDQEREMRLMMEEMERAARDLSERSREIEEEAARMREEMSEEEYEEFMEMQRDELEQMREDAFEMREEALELAAEERIALMESRREAQEEMMEVRREMAEEMGERHQEYAEERLERQREMREEHEEMRQRIHEEQAIASGHYRSSTAGFTSRMEEELRRDGFTEDGNYSFDMNTKRLKINGKKQADNIHEKYLDIYEATTGDSMCEDCQIVITKDD
ncbi:MAG: M56 family metallopeptidase [Bacteroidetes bacterium]|nr:M56 family metallopeptidase [Bacteroidota bacterium]